MLKRWKRVWKNIWKKLYKKDPNELDDYNAMVSHPEPDILDNEVKWDAGSTAVNKINGCEGIPVALFTALKHDAIKVLYSTCQQIGTTEQWPQD